MEHMLTFTLLVEVDNHLERSSGLNVVRRVQKSSVLSYANLQVGNWRVCFDVLGDVEVTVRKERRERGTGDVSAYNCHLNRLRFHYVTTLSMDLRRTIELDRY